jgi:outer membrane protein TolC
MCGPDPGGSGNSDRPVGCSPTPDSRPRHVWSRLGNAIVLSLFLGTLGCESAPGRAALGLRTSAVPQEQVPALSSEDSFVRRASVVAAGIAVPVERGAVGGRVLPERMLAKDTPAIPAPATEYPIDLGSALALAGAENPTVLLSEEAVRESLALQQQARALLLPSLNAGTDYNLHDGNLQTSAGIIRGVDRESLYFGAGAGAVGAGTVAIPGVRLFAHLADAIYAPLVARQVVANRRFGAAATRNQTLLDVATQYLALLGAEGRLAVIRQSQGDYGEIARLTAAYARTGQGRPADAERARADALLLKIQELRTQEEVAVAAAELARLLNLDPSVRLHIADEPIQVVQLVDPSLALEQLLQIAIRNRPEVGARGANVAAARARYRQEQVRPLLPLLSVGYSAGDFGGGSNLVSPRFGNFDSRTDFDVYAVWTLQNLGLGNLALQKNRRAEVDAASAELNIAINRIQQEVADAYALSAARSRAVEVARRQAERALEGFQLDLTRTRGAEALPIEVLNSAKNLARARQDLLRAIIGYDQAQFQLLVAIGQTPDTAPAYVGR